MAVGATFLVVAGAAVTFSDTIRSYLGDQATKAVTGVLRDEDIRNSASSTASELAESLLSDDRLRQDVATFLDSLATNPSTQSSVAALLISVLQQEATRTELATLLQHPETITAIQQLLIMSLDDAAVRRSLEEALSWLLADKAFQQVGMAAVLDVLHETLDNAKLRDHSSEALTAVVSDGRLQRSTGDALWNAVTWSVTPSILRADTAGTDTEAAGSASKDAAGTDAEAAGSAGSALTSADSAAADPADAAKSDIDGPRTAIAQPETADTGKPVAAGSQTPADSSALVPGADIEPGSAHKASETAVSSGDDDNRSRDEKILLVTQNGVRSSGSGVPSGTGGEVDGPEGTRATSSDSGEPGKDKKATDPPGGSVAHEPTPVAAQQAPGTQLRLDPDTNDESMSSDEVANRVTFRSPLSALIQANGVTATAPARHIGERR
jgi:hypothetical protein